MKIRHTTIIRNVPIALLGAGFAATPGHAAGIDLSLTIPSLKVAEYHKPYIAIWIEPKGTGAIRNLAIWYDYDQPKNEGTKWLRDVRQWWRKTGRTLTFPADGITGATRAPGVHKVAFTAGKGPLGTLPPGSYDLVVEASREVGGRELLRLPFQWPAKTPQTARAAGTTELGTVSAVIKP